MKIRLPRIRIAHLLVAILIMTNTGCLGGLIVAGVAATAAGGGAGYAYVRGEVPRDYPVDPIRAEAAVRAAMTELQFQEVRRERDGNKLSIETHTTNNNTITLMVSPKDKDIKSDPTVTRVSVRVGVFGDEALSIRILNTIDKYLVPGTPAATIQPAAFHPVSAPPPNETPVPPIAGSSGSPVTTGQPIPTNLEPQPVPVTRK